MNASNDILDFQGLAELASSRNIKVVEADGLEDSSGIRFQKSGNEWIAVNSSLSSTEKIRALGFLLNDRSHESLSGSRGARRSSGTNGEIGIYSLRCR
jgi:hypothetical protein